jgi:RNA polymerase sigma-70 factor (ECF subfamily)
MPSFKVVYEEQFDFVWTSVQRLGVDRGSVDDVVQEVFIVIHSRLHTLQHPEALRSWVYGVVRRTVSTYHRARRARANVSATADGLEVQSSEPTPFDVAQTNSDMEFVARVLAELDEPRRELLALVDLHELTVPEAAAALDMPLNTAYSRLRKARIAFEAALARRDARGEGR